MQHTPVALAPILSFFSSAFYREVTRHWRVAAFFHLLILLTVLWIPTTLGIRAAAQDFLSDLPHLTAQIPDITIENGVVYAAADQPHHINVAGEPEPFIIIDTTGSTSSLEETTAHVLLTRSSLFLRKGAAETRIYDLSGVQYFFLDKGIVYRRGRQVLTWAPLALYPILVLASFAVRVVQALLYAFLGLGFASLRGIHLRYRQICSIALIALTPALVLSTAVTLFPIEIPYSWAVYLLMSMGYVIFGIESNGRAPEISADTETGLDA